MANEDRLSFQNPPDDAASFDNFSQFVTALKLQFLEGIPPTPENVNRAQQRAEQVVLSGMNPDAGASSPVQQDASGGAGGVADSPAVASPITDSALTGGIPFDRPAEPQTAPLAPQAPVQGQAPVVPVPNGVPAGQFNGEGDAGGGIPNPLGMVGGATIVAAKVLHDTLANRPPNAAQSVPQLDGPQQPAGLLPAPDPNSMQLPAVIAQPNEASGPVINVPPEEAPIGEEGASKATKAEPITTGADRSAAIGAPDEAAARKAAEAIDVNMDFTFQDFVKVLPTDQAGSPNVEVLQTIMTSLFGGKGGEQVFFNNLSQQQRVALMQAVVAGNAATGQANANLTQGAGLETNRAGTQTVKPPNFNNALRKALGALR